MHIERVLEIPEGVGAVVTALTAGAAGEHEASGELGSRGFEGKPGQSATLAGLDGGPLRFFVGVGDEVSPSSLRRAAAEATRALGRHDQVAFDVLADASGSERVALAQAVAEGIALGEYRFRRYKTDDDTFVTTHAFVLGAGGNRVQDALLLGGRIGEAVCLARDLVNEPGGSMTPQAFAQVAAEVAEREDLGISILEEADIAEAGLGGLLGVNRGSDQPPRFVELTYEPVNPRGTLALVGKGITFDSGGLSIKPGASMMAMKNDMSGAAAVLGAMSVLPSVKPRCRVRAYIPLTDNMSGGDATRPGDVLEIRGGTTVEVLNTDAEGRLVLADALAVASDDEPDAIVDIATLTGAVEVALGDRVAGLMGNDDGWLDQLQAAAETTGEAVWRLPLPEEYQPWIESDVADLRNIGKVPKAGTIVAGLFLQRFVGEGIAWAHLDIAGTSWATETRGVTRSGGTGWGVRLLVELARTFRKPR